MSDRFIILSGCSGGGKSTLLEALHRRGHAVVEEPGRRIVQQELAAGGTALPWLDLAAFARRAVEMALADRAAMKDHSGLVFFDRGLIDAASALQVAGGEPVLATLAETHRYNRQVFLTPPWPEIYEGDPERRHGFEAALAEYQRLERTYPLLGYETVILPKAPVEARADFVLARL
ncbi:AAA family ATPase [Shinella sp. G-2]|uniref:AAA family ATPase n=1 Tax=Shinella sp. G-2 TaxID=3133141 RepID=UPI003CFC5160